MSVGSLKVKIFDAKGTQVVPVAKSTLTVGSASHCDIVIDHPSVQSEHVRAWLEGGRIWIQDLGTAAGTSLNGIRLPILKPMLVRELDMLKLGDCPATMALEANLVRAPVVKTQVALDEITATDIRPVLPAEADSGARRAELDALTREVAELKLQLQLGRAGGDGEELRRQLAQVKEELRQINDHRQKLLDTVAKLEQEKQSHRKSLEHEIAELKLKALRELKELREAEQRRFEIFKAESVVEANRQIRQITQAKVKSWATRPLSQDMIFEWEADLNEMLRRVIIGDYTGNQPPALRTPSEGVEPTQPSITKILVPSDTATKIVSAKTKTKLKKKKPADTLVRYLMMGLGSACLVSVAYLSMPYVRRAVRGRSVASAPVQQVDAASMTPAPTTVPAGNTPSRTVPAATAAARHTRYAPSLSNGFKKTYAENMVYTLNFEEAEMNADFRRKWITDLTKSARGWKVDDSAVTALVTKEMQFLLDLRRMKEGITSAQAEKDILMQMRKREDSFMKEVEGVLKNKQNVEKFLKFKRGFFTRNSQYLVRQTQ